MNNVEKLQILQERRQFTLARINNLSNYRNSITSASRHMYEEDLRKINDQIFALKQDMTPEEIAQARPVNKKCEIV